MSDKIRFFAAQFTYILPMHKTDIEFSRAGFSDLISDYLEGKGDLKPFYSLPPEPESFAKAIELKSAENTDRKTLVSVLTRQNEAHFDRYPQVRENTGSLSDSRTFTVTTGHQLNIFTGPLFFVYKIITTLNLAERLGGLYPEYRFVPVYWMASEDHDFDEISSISIFGKPVKWDQQLRGPAGKLPTETLAPVLEKVKEITGSSPNAEELNQLLSEAYGKGRTLAEATRALVYGLFGKYGLVIIDADEEAFKQQFRKIISDDIFHAIPHKLVSAVAEKLEHTYKAQAYPREINLFYAKEHLRERIEKQGDIFRVLNTSLSFTPEQMEREIADHPGRFSPNVVLRPLYQEMILPNLATIGGPAEMAYWMELGELFRHYGVSFPVLMLRNCLLWIDETSSEKLRKLGLKPEDVFSDTDLLIRKVLQQEKEISLQAEQEEVAALFESIGRKAAEIDPTLKATVEAEKQKQISAVQSIEARILRAQKKKSETTVAQVTAVREKLFPGGGLQERTESFIPFYLRYGAGFLEILRAQADPFTKHFTVLTAVKAEAEVR
jgi:bacillithiol synthase